jgi:glutathione S-transferase
VLNTVWAYYSAPDAKALEARRCDLLAQFARLEKALDAEGPWFAGAAFSVVDAAFAPVFRYFDAFEAVGEEDWFDNTPGIRAWRLALARRDSVMQAVPPGFPELLLEFLRTRGSQLSRRMVAPAL